MNAIILLILISLVSTGMYCYLHLKTRIALNYLYKDNILIILVSWLFSVALLKYTGFSVQNVFLSGIISVPIFGFLVTMIRFYRKPSRIAEASANDILSSADGNVIYIKKCKPKEIPENFKNGRTALLSEFHKSDLLNIEYWHIGINMTPFDVHRNSSPITGKVVMLEHFDGGYLTLKNKEALDKNERCSYLISNGNLSIGIVQIASRLVRRIESYIAVGDDLNRGDWIGMIKFGSQVDMIIPGSFEIEIKPGQQVYAGKTVIAKEITL